MKKLYLLLALLIPLGASASSVSMDDAWTRATPPGATTAAVYGTVTNRSRDAVKLADFRTANARMANLHTIREVDGVMQMRPADDVTLGPGESITFAPGGRHIMLMGLSGSLREGEAFEMEIVTGAGEAVPVPVDVGSISQMQAP